MNYGFEVFVNHSVNEVTINQIICQDNCRKPFIMSPLVYIFFRLSFGEKLNSHSVPAETIWLL